MPSSLWSSSCIATVILLYLSRREHAGRHEPLKLLSLTITALTKREHFSAVQDALRDPRRSPPRRVT